MRPAYRYILLCSNEETLPYIKWVVTSTGPCRVRIKTHRLLHSWSGGMSTELFAFHWNLQKKSWRTPLMWDICIDLKGWNAGHYLFRWKNTKLCVLFSCDQTKKIRKNVLHVWFSGVDCFISNIKWLGKNITVVKAMTILFIVHVQIEDFL